jgi:hypothetical protein
MSAGRGTGKRLQGRTRNERAAGARVAASISL